MPQVRKRFPEIVEECAALLGLHHHVIYVCMYVLSYLPVHAPLHGLLVSCSSVIQAKGHGDIAIGSIQGDEQCLYLIRLIQRDLMVARISIKKR
jgi:hypothetical protein